MAAPPNVELEAAKFLHKLIQESKDEPSKLATKLYVILQHMRSSGKENSMPYQVISRAMETVINQHGLDIDALMSSRLPLTTGIQVGDSASSQFGGSSLRGAITKEASASMSSSELNKIDAYASNRPPAGPSSAGHNIYQGSVSHLNSKSLDHESPSSFNTRSVKSHSEEKRDSLNWEKANKKDNKEGSSKRKRADPSLTSERQSGNLQPLDTSTCSSGMDKVATKIDQHRSLSIHGGEHGHFNNTIQTSSQMEHMTSLNSAMRSVLRAKQETQHQAEKSLDSTNISNSLSRVPHSRHLEEMEVSSAHNASGRQQEGSLQSTNDALNSRGLWNQTKIGLPFEKSQVQKFPFHASGGDSSAETFMHQSVTSPLGSGAAGKVYGTAPGALGPYAAAESGIPSPKQFSSSFDNHGLGPKMHKDRSTEAFSSAPSVDLPFYKGTLGKALEHEGGILNTSANANNTVQGGILNNITETTMLRSTGKSPISQSPAASGMPFKDQHLKQLRAQCLVYLAFRNGLMPKKLHLDIALGNVFPKEDGPSKEMIDQKGKEQSVDGPSSTPDVTIPVGRLDNPRETERSRLGPSSIGMFADANLSKEGYSMNMVGGKNGMPSGQMKTEVTGWTGNGCNDESVPVPVPERKDNAPSQSFRLGDHNFQGSQHADAYSPSFPLREQQKPLSRMDGGNHLESQVGETDQEEEDISVSTDLPPSPKYTTSEKWIMDQQKRKLLSEQTWAVKQQKTKQRITVCADKLKDNVSSSEDISAKTRSVIELKKLQLLELQNRLRNDILNDFFKPITSDMDRLKSIKKHRIGRRSKQLEKFEQKMKEERQKRFRERQKEFFSEIEVHKERVEDVLKMRRERWKGFNKYVREFHKRKERVHREKIDRIQREKINLLKVNDVEGYLRMVQDAKSDRVKQLLKETEKYLQKLGSKLQDAKAMSRCFETEMDDNRSAGVMEKSEITIENEDETDQAKHYLESNEKYYLMAHSIKENVAEQPSCLVGGKLREYQMNGLRWLVSLYNNHLNGILADEMGLGKTVQVISLICYLMEAKNDRGPFLVVVPSSVLPGWDSEINFWAPSINKIVYSGPPEERRRLFKERIVPRKFNVLLTTYEYLMNKHDRPKLSKIHWHYVIIDEGHRIKNASCKLNADLKLYRSSHRLLLTGTPLQNNLEELWALLNFLLPNIFNSSEDFSQWFNKPFESNGDSSPDEALLSEEENLLIINRLHQVLRPFVLRRLKHKVENELPEKIERLVRCEASAYQKLLMKRVEENLGALGTSKARSVHNSVMELRNICNHPYLSQLHVEEVHDFIPKHYLPNVVRLCGKLEMLDRILPKLKATDHRVLLFSTMTRLLDVMEDYLYWKQYKYLRLDGHTSGGDRGALIDQFNKPGSPYFIFLLSIRAGGVGVNLQAADTVIIFDTDWNPQVDLQAQARAHRIGQKREVLVLRFETVQTVEEQVRAAAEHKLGVANQSITAGFFDNNTSAEDRREYLESLLRESKKEEVAPVLHDDALNDLIARSESEIDIFESVDRSRQEEEMAAWKLELGHGTNGSEPVLALPSRLLTDDDLKPFCEAMKISDAPTPAVVSNVGVKRKNEYLGGLDTQHYGRGKRAREVRSYEEQWTEDEFEKMCQVESPQSPKLKGEVKEMVLPMVAGESVKLTVKTETMVSAYQTTEPPKPSVQPPPVQSVQPPSLQSAQPPPVQLVQPPPVQSVQPPSVQLAQPPPVQSAQPPLVQSAQPPVMQSAQPSPVQSAQPPPVQSAQPPPVKSAQPPPVKSAQSPLQQLSVLQPAQPPLLQPSQQSKEVTPPSKRGRGRPKRATTQIPPSQMVVPAPSGAIYMDVGSQRGTVSICSVAPGPESLTSSSSMRSVTGTIHQFGILSTPSSQATATLPSASPGIQSTTIPCPSVPIPDKRRGRKAKSGGETPRQRGRKPSTVLSAAPVLPAPSGTDNSTMGSQGEIVSSLQFASGPDTISCLVPAKDVGKETSTLSLVPVLLPSSGTVKLSVESQETQVSSSPIFSSSSILTGTSDHTQDLRVGTAGSQPTPQMVPVPPDSQSISVGTDPSSQPNPPFPSVPLGPQSVPPSHSLPKQLKGRGHKAQSEGEAPRRRGRKQDAASTVPDKSGDQEPTSIEPPEKKSRGSAGRKAIVTRSKQQNEAQKLMNLIQAEVSNVHTSLGFAGVDSVVTGESYQSAQNKQGTSSSGSIHVAATSRDKESSNIKDNQLDAMISGDGILSTKIEDCQCSEDPAGKEIHNAGVKDVSPAIKEVTVDNQSSETEIRQSLSSEPGDELIGVSKPSFLEVSVTQSSDSKIYSELSTLGTAPVSDLPNRMRGTRSEKEGVEKVEEMIKAPLGVIVTSNPEFSESEGKRSVDVLISSTTISEQLTDTRIGADDDLGGPTLSNTNTDVTENQSLEERKCSALSTSESMTVTQSSDDKSNTASSTLGTDQVSDLGKIASPSEKGGGEKVEVIKPLHDGSATPTPKVHKPECLRNAADFVLNIAVPDKSIEESLKSKDDNGTVVHYVGEKSTEAKDSVVDITAKVVSYTEEKLVEVNDAMVEIRESVHSYEEKEARDRKGKDIRSSGAEYMSDNAAGVTNVLNSDADGVVGFLEEESLVVKKVMSDGNISKEYSGEKLGSRVHAGVAPEDNVKDYAAAEKSEVKREFEANESSESKGENVSPQTLELKHDFAEVESLMKERETKPSEEVVEAFKGAADHERREHQGVLSHAFGDAVTDVGQSQTQVKEGGYKGRSEYREQGEFKPEVEEGGPEYMEENHQLSETGIIEKSKPKSSEEVEEVSQGPIENEKRDHVGGGLHVIIETMAEIGEAKEELLVGLGQTQTMLEECSKQEEFREKVWQDEKGVPETTVVRHDPAAGGTIDGEEAKPSEKIKEVCDGVTNERKEKEQQGSGVLEATRDATVEIRQTMEELLVKQCLTQAEVEVFQQASEPERGEHGGEVVYATEDTTTKIGQTQNELLVEQSLTQADEAITFEKVEEVFEETVQHERMEQQEGGVFHSPGETLAKIEQTTEEINVEHCQTQAEAKPNERVEVLEVTEPERREYKEGGVFHVVGETASEFGLTEELVVEQCQTRIEQVIPSEKVQVFQGATAHEIKEQNEGRVLHAGAESIAEFGQTTEEILVGLCQTEAKEAKADVIIKEVFEEATEHDRRDHPEDGVLHSIVKTVGEIRQTTEQLLIEPCQTIEEQTKPFDIVEEVLHAVTETSVEIGQRLEEPHLEQLQTRAKEEPEPSSVVEEFLNTGAETKVEIGQIVEELPIEQCQIQTKEDSKPNEKAEVFQGASVLETMEQGGRVLQTGSESTGEVGQTLEELPVQQHQTQSEEPEPSSVVEEFLNTGAETKVEIGQIVEELPIEQCQIQTKEDSEPSEMVKVVLHACVETIGEVGQRLEELPIEQCQTLAKADSKPSEKAEEVFEGANVHDTTEQGGRVLQTGSESTVEVGQTLEELPVQQCQTQLESEPSKKVEVSLNIGAETAVEIGQIVEELPIEQCQIQTKEDSELSEMVKVVLHACVETIGEVGQRLEELPIEQCQTLAKADSKTSEKAEEVFEGANVHDTTEQGGRVLQTVSECTDEVGQTLEELPVQHCQTQSKEESEPSKLAEVFQEAIVHEISEQQESGILHAIVETAVEIRQTKDVLLGEQCQTQAEEAKRSEEVKEVLLVENAHDRRIQQRSRVLHAGAEATVEIGQREEELPVEQCRIRAKEDSEPSEKAEILQEAIEHERKEELGGRLLQAIETSDFIELKTEEPVGMSQARAKDEVKHSEKVEAFDKVTEHDRREEQRGGVSHIPGETTNETGQTKQEGLAECQTEVNEADRPNEVEVTHEGTKNEGMEQQVGVVVRSIEKLTEELIEPDQAQEREDASTGSSGDFEKGRVDA